jgi:hypothetical protein
MSNTKVAQARHFVKETLARLEGDQDTVLAEKNARKALVAISGQINALTSKAFDLEEKVDNAKEELVIYKYPTKAINDRADYVSGILMAQNRLATAEAALAGNAESIEFLETVLAEFKG